MDGSCNKAQTQFNVHISSIQAPSGSSWFVHLHSVNVFPGFLMQNGIKLKKTAEEEDGMISNKKPRKATLAKDKLYGCFVKVIVCCLSAACPFLLNLLQFSHHTACHSLLVTGVTR